MGKKVLIELFTLDSGGCAPCTYMKELALGVSHRMDGNMFIGIKKNGGVIYERRNFKET